MDRNRIGIGESFEISFTLFRQQLGLWLMVMGIFMAISIAPGFFNGMQSQSLQGLIAAILMVLSTVVGMGMLKVGLNTIDRQESSLGDLFSLVHLFIRYFFMSLLAGAVTLAGLVLLIVPGIVLMVRLGFADLYIVDSECGPVESLRFSWELTRGYTAELVLFGLALLGINLAGLMLLGLGLFVTIPVTYIARAYVFRKLQYIHQAGEMPAEPAV